MRATGTALFVGLPSLQRLASYSLLLSTRDLNSQPSGI